MKFQNCGPYLGKLVYQIPGVITLAYDLRFATIIPRFEDLEEKAKNKQEICFGTFLLSMFTLKKVI